MCAQPSQQTPSFLPKLADFLATGFYSGRIPGPGGTWGTIAALLLSWIAFRIAPALSAPLPVLLTALVCTVLGILLVEIVLRAGLYGENKDPRQIVIDEFAGFFVSIISAQGQLREMVLCFILFRLFDITKPYPCRRLEKLHGGFGVVLDDIVAGFYALFFSELLKPLLF